MIRGFISKSQKLSLKFVVGIHQHFEKNRPLSNNLQKKRCVLIRKKIS